MPSTPVPPPTETAITRATTALVVAADELAAALDATPDDHGRPPTAGAWLTTALHATAVAHDAAVAAQRELGAERG